MQMMRRAPAAFVHMKASATFDSLNQTDVTEMFVPHHIQEFPHEAQDSHHSTEFRDFPMHYATRGARSHHSWLAKVNNANEEKTTAVTVPGFASTHVDSEIVQSGEFKISKEETEAVEIGDDKVKDGPTVLQVTQMSMKEMNDMSKAIMQLVAWLLFGNMIIILAVCIWQVFSPKKKDLQSAELLKLSSDDQTGRSPQITSLAQLTALAQAPLLEATLSGPTSSAQPEKSDGLLRASPPAGITNDLALAIRKSTSSSSRSEGARTRSNSRHDSRRRSRSIADESPKDDSARCLRTVDALCTPGRRTAVN
jgi:hypothetical protein